MAHEARGEPGAEHESRHDHGLEVEPEILARRHEARGRQQLPAAPRRAGSAGCRARNSGSTGPTARRRWRHSRRSCPSCTADRMPAGMPISSAMIMAKIASWSVTGSLPRISVSTGMSVRSEMPRLPCSTWPIQAKYWIGIGSSRRYFSRRGEHLAVALLARHRQHRIARQELLQGEDEDRHEDERRDRDQDAAGDEAKHGRSGARPAEADVRPPGRLPGTRRRHASDSGGELARP